MKLKDLYEKEYGYEILNFDEIQEPYKRILKNNRIVDLTIKKDDNICVLDENFVTIPFSKELLECEVISNGVKIFSYDSGLGTLSFKVRILRK